MRRGRSCSSLPLQQCTFCCCLPRSSPCRPPHARPGGALPAGQPALPPQLEGRALVWHRGADVVRREAENCPAALALDATQQACHFASDACCTESLRPSCPQGFTPGSRRHPCLGPQARLSNQLLAAAAHLGSTGLAGGTGENAGDCLAGSLQPAGQCVLLRRWRSSRLSPAAASHLSLSSAAVWPAPEGPPAARRQQPALCPAAHLAAGTQCGSQARRRWGRRCCR